MNHFSRPVAVPAPVVRGRGVSPLFAAARDGFFCRNPPQRRADMGRTEQEKKAMMTLPPAALTRSVIRPPARRQMAPKAAPLTKRQVEDSYARITDPRARARYRAMYSKELGISRKGK